MSISDTYDTNDAVGLAELVRAGEVTAEELLEEAIRRADARNPAINAIVHRFDDLARDQATRSGAEGPLAGVPFLLKDLGATYAGTPLTNGSRAWRGYECTGTEYLVERYLRAGLSIFGRTNSPELGLSSTTENLAHGPARNPWNTAHSTGGSSGGAGAAVAAGIVPIAHASDGGGSIRIPASCNGLVGMKPTRARTPSGPPEGEGWAGLSIHHVVSRTVRDNAAVLDATHGVAPGGPYDAPAPGGSFLAATTRPPSSLRIGISACPQPGTDVHPDVAAAVNATGLQLTELGHNVADQSLDHLDWTRFRDAFGTITNVGLISDIETRVAETGIAASTDIFEPLTMLMYERAAGMTAAQYLAATQAVHELGRATAAVWQDIDVLVCPTMPQPPAEIGMLAGPIEDVLEWAPRLMAATSFTSVFNATGQPAMSLPLATSAAGLPLGIQLVGRFGDEETLFSLAGQLEQAMPWADRSAPTVA